MLRLFFALAAVMTLAARADVLPSPGDLSDGRDRIMGLWLVDVSPATSRQHNATVLAIGNAEFARIDFYAQLGGPEEGDFPPASISNFYAHGGAASPYEIISHDDKMVVIRVTPKDEAPFDLEIHLSGPDAISIGLSEPWVGVPPAPNAPLRLFSFHRLRDWIPGMPDWPEAKP